MNTTEPIEIQNSWGNLLAKANHLAKNYNDDALPLYDKLLTRLSRMPEKQLRMNEQLLYRVYIMSHIGLAEYQTRRGFYTKSIDTLTKLHTYLNDSDADSLLGRIARLHLMAGQLDTALEAADVYISKSELWIGAWIQKLELLMDAEQYDELDTLVKQVEAKFFDDKKNYIDLTGDERAEDEQISYSLISNYRARIALQHGQPDEALRGFTEAFSLDKSEYDNPQYAYQFFFEKGYNQHVLDLIATKEDDVIWTKFWSGLAHYRMGDHTTAQTYWQEVLDVDEADMESTTSSGLAELIFAHLYTGDTKGNGLGAVLGIIHGEQDVEWIFYLLAGFGWGIRGNSINARSNFDLARGGYRLIAYRDALPHSFYLHCQDLFDEDMLAEVEEYFK